jgi:hypothetical protein
MQWSGLELAFERSTFDSRVSHLDG